MKFVIRLLKKDPFLVILGFLAAIQLLWFGVAPQWFKATWSRNPLVAEIIKEHNAVDIKADWVAISYYYPDFQYFAGIASGTAQPQKELMDGYHFGKPYIFAQYYSKAVHLFPDMDEPHYLFAFCEYYLGHPDVAVQEYQKSLDINAYFFWVYYNLGVIYFQHGDYLPSVTTLGKAISVDRTDVTLAIVHQSPFYRQIWRRMPNLAQTLGSNLGQGQQDAALLLAACLVNVEGYPQALEIIQSLGRGIVWHREFWDALHKMALAKQRPTAEFNHLLAEQIPVRLF